MAGLSSHSRHDMLIESAIQYVDSVEIGHLDNHTLSDKMALGWYIRNSCRQP